MSAHSIGSMELNKTKFQEQDLLDVIDSLRSQGLGQHVSLPQLIVCGDQSAGKSSVLEAISGIPFPTNDGLCTVFATEMVLRKADNFNVTVRISSDPLSASTRSEAELKRLLEFGGNYDKSANFQSIIENAKDAMGISKEKTFSNDRLRIEVSGPDLTSLTIVDLPGLFHAGENSDPVQNMVRKYMENPRSVILAVVSAKNDVANQIVLKLTKDFDPTGFRTIGIITKPDTLSVGSANETKILSLLRNEDRLFKFRHGWHILKNRSFEETGTSSEERDDAETAFFSQGVWKGVLRSLVGIKTLRPRLNSLIKISQSFQSIVNAAVDGSYSKAFFKDARSKEGYNRRLRAVVQNLNREFMEEMRLNGHRIDFKDDAPPPPPPRASSPTSRGSSESGESDSDASDSPIVSRDDFLTKVMELVKRSRGRELPGMFNPLIVADLFKEQSEPWGGICSRHMKAVMSVTKAFICQTIFHLADEKVVVRLVDGIIGPALYQLSQSMSDKLREVLRASQDLHPITYNHYFTDTLQQIKAARQRATISAVVLKFFSPNSKSKKTFTGTIDPSALIAALSDSRKEPDMDKFAALELIDYMKAYYKVSLKTTVDNVAVQVVEETLIQKLQDILSPTLIGGMNASSISQIAGESLESQAMREELKSNLKVLQAGLDTCKPFATLTKKVDLHRSGQYVSNSSDKAEQVELKSDASRNTATSSKDLNVNSAKANSGIQSSSQQGGASDRSSSAFSLSSALFASPESTQEQFQKMLNSKASRTATPQKNRKPNI